MQIRDGTSVLSTALLKGFRPLQALQQQRVPAALFTRAARTQATKTHKLTMVLGPAAGRARSQRCISVECTASGGPACS